MLIRWINFWSQIHGLALCATLMTGAWWWRVFWLKELSLPLWLKVEAFHFYHFGFFAFVLIAVLAWLLTGLRGLGRLAESGNIWWVVLLWQLGIWGRISFGADTLNVTVALAESTEFLWVVFFTTSFIANPPPLRWVLWSVVGGMLSLVSLGILQTLLQHEVGIGTLTQGIGIKEFNLDPSQSGISVIGVSRFLRPYGLAAHPNLMVGGVVIGLLAAWVWWGQARQLALIITGLGWWGLLLSFSRAGVGGYLLGLGGMGFLWALNNWRNRALTPINGEGVGLVDVRGVGLALFWMAGLAVLFIGVYGDLALGRVEKTLGGEQNPTFEDFSAASRAVYREQALQLIPDHLGRGVGRGNFAWHSAYLLYCCDDRDLRGDHVHHIYLLALVEEGVVGLSLYLLAIGYGLGLILWRAWCGRLAPLQAALAGGVIAWLGIGWFDHYPWTQFGHQLLFWGIFAAALSVPQSDPAPPSPPEAN